jgi:hypothetical protein
MWGNNQPPVIGGPELTEGLNNYHKLAEDFRRASAAKRIARAAFASHSVERIALSELNGSPTSPSRFAVRSL